MKKTFLLIINLLAAAVSFSQTAREVIIKPGDEPSEAFPFREKYRFSEFHNGYLITRDGKRSKALKLNLNIFSGVPQYIGETGDTLFLDEHIARYVQIREVTFLHEFPKGYYELILKTEPVKLAINRTWKRTRVEKVYVDPHSGEITKSISRGASTIYSEKLSRDVRNENIVYRRDSAYFFIDAKERIFKTNKTNLLKIFSDHSGQIEEWLKTQSIDFDKEEDLRRLFEFCIPLAAKK